MRHKINTLDTEQPQHKRITIRNRQMGAFAGRRTNFWNNNHSCYSVWNLHMTQKEIDYLSTDGKLSMWKFRPPVHGKVIQASYVVFSYGCHHPLYVYDNVSGRWFENRDRVSQTTTQHRADARPKDKEGKYVSTFECNTSSMVGVARFGLTWAVKNVLLS